MHIEYKCSGGYAGLRLAYRAETDELPSEEAGELSELIKASGAFDLTQEQLAKKSRNIPDDFSCQLTILEAGNKKTLSFQELSVPGSLRRLSVHLRKLALKERDG